MCPPTSQHRNGDIPPTPAFVGANLNSGNIQTVAAIPDITPDAFDSDGYIHCISRKDGPHTDPNLWHFIRLGIRRMKDTNGNEGSSLEELLASCKDDNAHNHLERLIKEGETQEGLTARYTAHLPKCDACSLRRDGTI